METRFFSKIFFIVTMLLSSVASYAAEHLPVIMIPGNTGDPSSMQPMQSNLQSNGWSSSRLYAWTDADKMNIDMERSAAAIRDKVNAVLAQTGASKVVLATWSASTIAGRYYIKNLGGDQKVKIFASFAGPHHGIANWTQCKMYGYTSCTNQWGPVNPNTPWLINLNSGTEVPGWPNVRYLTLRGSADTNAAPITTSILQGADEDALFPGLTHYNIITDAAPLAKLRSFIQKWEFEPTDGPTMTSCTATSTSNSSVDVRGAATDPTSTIVSYRVQFNGPSTVNDAAAGSGTNFFKTYSGLATGSYSGTVTATNSAGKTSLPCQLASFGVGQPPASVGHDPVIIMTGASGDLSKTKPLVDYLRNNGWADNLLVHWKDSTGFQGDVATTANEIGAKVNSVLTATGKSKVVLVGWSSSAVSSRYYIKKLGGAQKVSQFISIAGPHHGITNYAACQYLWVSCKQWGPIPLTQFMVDLNAGTEVPGSPTVKYLTMRGTADTNAAPVDTALLAGADEQILFQGLDHYTLITNAAAQAKVRDFIIAHEGQPPEGVPTNLSVTSFTSNSVTLSWNAASGASGYNVYSSTTSGGPWTRTNSGLLGGTSATVSGLTTGTTYYFVVRAQKSDGSESANSNQVSQNTNGTGGGGGWTEKVTDTVVNHYVAGRVTVAQYNVLGARYGYTVQIPLYHCMTGWTDKTDCGPI
ncbi:hypothetical protein BH11PSE11_BH11PSE11_13920 [soil metagenome]